MSAVLESDTTTSVTVAKPIVEDHDSSASHGSVDPDSVANFSLLADDRPEFNHTNQLFSGPSINDDLSGPILVEPAYNNNSSHFNPTESLSISIEPAGYADSLFNN